MVHFLLYTLKELSLNVILSRPEDTKYIFTHCPDLMSKYVCNCTHQICTIENTKNCTPLCLLKNKSYDLPLRVKFRVIATEEMCNNRIIPNIYIAAAGYGHIDILSNIDYTPDFDTIYKILSAIIINDNPISLLYIMHREHIPFAFIRGSYHRLAYHRSYKCIKTLNELPIMNFDLISEMADVYTRYGNSEIVDYILTSNNLSVNDYISRIILYTDTVDIEKIIKKASIATIKDIICAMKRKISTDAIVHLYNILPAEDQNNPEIIIYAVIFENIDMIEWLINSEYLYDINVIAELCIRMLPHNLVSLLFNNKPYTKEEIFSAAYDIMLIKDDTFISKLISYIEAL